MCEFKIIRKNDDSQILEDIVVLGYTETNELLFKDILGIGEKLDSALILDVNTLNQTCVVFEHPLIKEFIGLMKNVNNNQINPKQIESFQKSIEMLNKNL
ncbi:MAG: hypothetical protein ACFFA0_07860 [Promethearchaeota archaeon]